MVNVIPPSDYVIQKTKRTAPQVVHGDKLKLLRGHPAVLVAMPRR